jgi:hypothetical protein
MSNYEESQPLGRIWISKNSEEIWLTERSGSRDFRNGKTAGGPLIFWGWRSRDSLGLRQLINFYLLSRDSCDPN